MKKGLKRKISLFLSAYLTLLLCAGSMPITKAEPDIIYCEDFTGDSENPFACINGKEIYIGTKHEIDSIDKDGENIYIKDRRKEKDPDMEVCDSHKITDEEEIECILEVLEEYEKRYPSLWKRTIGTMKKEWLIHNFCYFIGYHTRHTENVDLNNNDEEQYANNNYIKLYKKHLEKVKEEEQKKSSKR